LEIRSLEGLEQSGHVPQSYPDLGTTVPILPSAATKTCGPPMAQSSPAAYFSLSMDKENSQTALHPSTV
jgi:hypothetical protein